jgi:hypothetical protein
LLLRLMFIFIRPSWRELPVAVSSSKQMLDAPSVSTAESPRAFAIHPAPSEPEKAFNV